MIEKPYWVEADRAVQDHSRVIGYSVWHFSETGGRECIKRFSVTRKGGWETALGLANIWRDDLNETAANEFTYDEKRMFPFAADPHRMTD